MRTTFQVEVEGIGTFTFARRAMRDHIKIAVEFSKLTDGVETPSRNLEFIADIIATLRVLTVEAPDGWDMDLDKLDPLDDDTFPRILKVFTALREKELSFRQDKDGGKQKNREAGIDNP